MKDNKLIAEFMGASVDIPQFSLNYDTDELKFNVLDCDIEGAHKEVVEFIKEYNDNPKHMTLQ